MNNTDYIISSGELFDKIQQDASDNNIKIAAQFLLDAINDWPTLNLSEPKEFLLELTNEFESPLTFGRIENYSKTLNAGKSTWKMESISSLLELFDYDRTKTLDEIVRDITEYYKSR